ncbi:hypothetical protein DES53_12420 [Roseimicrobium gellanilyticum]|uniref:Uncharacterized protein n=1 Tax=Roseimicrobium gellanilyticum TaxID=748857 RepID=A0A366H141_9BACT|nr:hypothetical protein [Roseimicrobium gellanilyticum]RBP35220.1 hypothetical protein DES53_12420 [Roseimicrobium gellanilyticum]
MRFSLCASAILVAAGFIVLPSCSKDKESASSQVAGAITVPPKPTKLTDVPQGERDDLDAFGRQLEADLLAKNIPGIKAAFHELEIVEQVMASMHISGLHYDFLKQMLERGMPNKVGYIAQNWSEQEAKYKGLALHDGKVNLRFRFLSDSGILFLDLHVARRPSGRLGIIDYYNQATGGSFSDQMRQVILPALTELDKQVAGNPAGHSSSMALDDIKQLSLMTRHFQNKDFKGIIDAYHQLSPEMKNSLMAISFRLDALKQLQDLEGYKDALLEAAKTNRSPNFQFLLMDVYAIEKNYDKALECLDLFMAATGEDAALLTVKGTLQLDKGAHDAARATIHEALALEPDSSSIHLRALEVLLVTRDHQATAASVRFLQEQGGVKLNLTDPDFAEFMKSPESAPWR